MKKPVYIILAILAIVILHTVPVMAAESASTPITPDTPAFTIDVSEHEETFTFTIQKTANADGYRIYAKEPGNKKYQSIATIKKSGKAVRTYTYSPFNPGK